MLRYLLDTNIVSEPARPNPSRAVVNQMQDRSAEVALPAIAWHELIYGVSRMNEGRRRSYLREYLYEVLQPSMPILPYDESAARWHGTARATLEDRGRFIPFADGQIAAIAATRDLILVTRNTADFQPFQTLEDDFHLEDWFTQ